jgi:hypothetical protein
MRGNVRGGAGAAIVYALTLMLKHKENYDYVGLCESDVLLPFGWFEPTMALFARGRDDGLDVGAVSTRCYEDRVLFARDGYSICINLGAGQIIFSRKAAEAVLNDFRTPWTSDVRRVFAQLAGHDIASFWAFRANEHFLTADFHWEPVLAAKGMAALALTPSPVEMIGQNPPLAEQGLTIVREPVEKRRKDNAFDYYAGCLKSIRDGKMSLGIDTRFHYDVPNATWTYFPHQMAMLGVVYSGDWRFEECRGWGTFKWVAGHDGINYPEAADELFPSLTVPVFGPCSILISGGAAGGKVEVVDEQSGFKADPVLPAEGPENQILQMMVPGGLTYRRIRITMLSPGTVFYGIQSREKQPFLPGVGFDHSVLPSS